MGFALIFDLDGVIVDNGPHHERAWLLFAKRKGINLTSSHYWEKINGRHNPDILKGLLPGITEGEIKEFSLEKERIYRELYKEDLKLAEGLIDLLDSVDAPRAIATSAPPENTSLVLENTNLKDYFDIIVDPTMVKKSKPDPEIYLLTAKKLGFDPSECIVIEDSPVGVKAGKDAGMKVIGITSNHTKEELQEAGLVIDSFRELNLDRLKKL